MQANFVTSEKTTYRGYAGFPPLDTEKGFRAPKQFSCCSNLFASEEGSIAFPGDVV